MHFISHNTYILSYHKQHVTWTVEAISGGFIFSIFSVPISGYRESLFLLGFGVAQRDTIDRQTLDVHHYKITCWGETVLTNNQSKAESQKTVRLTSADDAYRSENGSANCIRQGGRYRPYN